MTIVPLNQLWVEANFKEGQVRHMKPGMAATVVADLYGGDVVYHGTVQGLAAGTGSAFALLPAQNASGNWIKVVQRVPVRIALDPEELAAHPLRVGLSLRVEVDLRETGEAPPPDHSSFATAVFSEDSTAVDAMIAGIIHDNLGS
jgi:membrane fusion protein (multidrug efflux system)